MSKVVLREDSDGEWHVWISLEDDEPPEGLNFIIGCGATREAAIADAVQDLRDNLKTLESGIAPDVEHAR